MGSLTRKAQRLRMIERDKDRLIITPGPKMLEELDALFESLEEVPDEYREAVIAHAYRQDQADRADEAHSPD